MTAKLPYVDGDYGNSDIHDTHAGTTDYNIWFPEDFPTANGAERALVCTHIISQIQSCLDVVAKILAPNAKPYDGCADAYEVLGCDFLVTADHCVKLLEINDHTGFAPCGVKNFDPSKGPWTDDFNKFSADYFAWVYKNAIAPSLRL